MRLDSVYYAYYGLYNYAGLYSIYQIEDNFAGDVKREYKIMLYRQITDVTISQ